MKRRTHRTAAVIGKEHRAAFLHAWEFFGRPKDYRRADDKPIYNRKRERIRFGVKLEAENGFIARCEFSNILGFRFVVHISSANRRDILDRIEIARPHRLLSVRLPQYREAIVEYQDSTRFPLTFRAQSQLIAACAFDVKDEFPLRQPHRESARPRRAISAS